MPRILTIQSMNSDTKYTCPVCGYEYKEEKWAKECEAWCTKHNSCNLEIIKHGQMPGKQQSMNYSYKKQTSLSFDEAKQRMKDELAKEGFGVLWEIDVQKTMKEKLNKEYDDYTILGACNPSLADEALQAEEEIGLFLPCNLLVYKQGDSVFVSVVLPTKVMSVVNNPALKNMAKEAEEKLKRAVGNV